MKIALEVLDYAMLGIFVYFIYVQSTYLLLLFLSLPYVFRRVKERSEEDYNHLLTSVSVPKIAIISPAFNEQASILSATKHLLNLDYRNVEVIVVNDGSQDATLDVLVSGFDLFEVPPVYLPKLETKKVKRMFRSRQYPSLIVVDKENGGKVDSMNAGINIAEASYFVAIDADTILPDDTLLSLIRPFMTQKNVVAAGGAIGIGNECRIQGAKIMQADFPKEMIPSLQVIEYLRAFSFGRLGWNALGGPMIISGAFGLFAKDPIIELGGYQMEFGDDVEMTIRLHRTLLEQKRPYRVEYIPDLVAWTEAPRELKSLGNQRERWHVGLLNALAKHRVMMLNPKYKKVGLMGYPHLVVIEGISPVVESVGYIIVITCALLGKVYWVFAGWLLALSLLFPMVLSLTCLLLDDISSRRFQSLPTFGKIVGYIIFEQFGYRQVMVWYRLKAVIKWLLGKQVAWVSPTRKGF